MKVIICVLMLCCLMAGCGAQENLEILGDPCAGDLVKCPAEIILELPEQDVDAVLQEENGTLYLCDQMAVSVQTLQGGDLSKTIRDCAGYGYDDLTILQTKYENQIRYDSVCAVAGEGEEQILRFAIIDDGAYHYVVTAMIDSTSAEQHAVQITDILGSFSISTDQ